MGGNPVQQLPPIRTVHPDLPQLLAGAAQARNQQPRPRWVRGRARRDHHRQHQAQRIDQQMPLAPLDLFAGVVAPRARDLGGLDTLAVQRTSGGVFVAPRAAAHLGAQGVVDALPRAIVAPLAEIVVDGLPFGIVMRQHAPLTAGDDDVQDGVDDVAHVDAPGAAARFCRRDQWRDTLPLAVGQIGWVPLVLHTPSYRN